MNSSAAWSFVILANRASTASTIGRFTRRTSEGSARCRTAWSVSPTSRRKCAWRLKGPIGPRQDASCAKNGLFESAICPPFRQRPLTASLKTPGATARWRAKSVARAAADASSCSSSQMLANAWRGPLPRLAALFYPCPLTARAYRSSLVKAQVRVDLGDLRSYLLQVLVKYGRPPQRLAAIQPPRSIV